MNDRLFSKKISLLAVLLTLAVAPATASAQPIDNQVPGLGANTPPKVMIIFDTSKSMGHMPGSDLIGHPRTWNMYPPASDFYAVHGNFSYQDDDFNPGNPTGRCLSRFCVAKKVLYNVLPTYLDDIQAGLAGYAQYRTQWLPPTAKTSCVYDVISPPNQSVSFVSSDPGLAGLTIVPPNIAGLCDTAHHQYTLPATMPTAITPTAQTCSVFAKDVPDTVTNGPFRNQVVDSGCSNDPMIPSFSQTAASTYVWPGLGWNTDSIYVRADGVGRCVAGNTLRYLGKTGLDQIYSTTGPYVPASRTDAGIIFFRPDLSPVSTPQPGGSYTCASNKPCDFTYTGSSQYDNNRSVKVAWADGGDVINFGSVEYSFDGGPSLTKSGAVITHGAECMWPGTSDVATIGEDRVYASVAGFNINFGPGEGNCQNLGLAGCRVFFASVADAGTTSGNWRLQTVVNGPPPQNFQNNYQTIPTETVNYQCDVSGEVRAGSYTNDGGGTQQFDVPALNAGESCPNYTLFGTNQIGGVAVPGIGGECNFQRCDLTNGTPIDIADNTAYYGPLQNPGARVLVGVLDAGTLTKDVAGYASPCMGNATSPGEKIDAGVGDFALCGTNGCQLEFIERAMDAGTRPSHTRYSPLIAPYDAGTVSTPLVYVYNSSIAERPTSTFVQYQSATGDCSSTTRRVTSGTVGPATCSSEFPCDLKLSSATPICKRDNVVTTCVGESSDSFVLRFCEYRLVEYTYSAEPYGVCKYNLKQWKYKTPSCRYTRKRNNATPPNATCVSAPGLRCGFSISGHQYSYSDPAAYCEAKITQRTFSGTAPSSYTYTYATKGGEYLGSIVLSHSSTFTPTSRPRMAQRNWCELGTSGYTNIASECPEVIDSSNSSGFSDSLTTTPANMVCTGGRTCKLRWRSSYFDGVTTYDHGRASYFQPVLFSEKYDPANPQCIVPDRTGGEVVAPSADTLMTVDSVSTPTTPVMRPPDGTSTGAFIAHGDTYTLTPGTYTIDIEAYQQKLYSEDARLRLAIVADGTATETTFVVPSTSASNPTKISHEVTLSTSLNIQTRLDNADSCSACGVGGVTRKLFVKSLTFRRKTMNFCLGSANTPSQQVRLRSDWYEPGTAATTQPYVDVTTQESTHQSGWSRNSSDNASFVFVPLAPGNTAEMQQALTQCVRPTDLYSPPAGGLCMSDTDNCGNPAREPCQSNAMNMQDFTPLYGSLKNAEQYMRDQLRDDSDTEWMCRDYYVLLVTDGLESSPRGFTQTNLRDQVVAMRNTSVGGREKDVKTFVIGFGAGLTGDDAGISDVDIIARAGGTALRTNAVSTSLFDKFVYDPMAGRALSATNAGELEQTLNWVFSAISAGRFARSRPTLSTDGKRIYQAYFERGGDADAGSPELMGNLLAFRIETTGDLTQMWQYRPKLDAQLPSSRHLNALLRLPDAGVRLEPFVETNSDLTTYMNELWGAGTDAGGAVIQFVRNDTLGAGTHESFAPIPVPRTTRAAAIMFSTPVVVGPPPFGENYGGNSGEVSRVNYLTYRTNYRDRKTQIVFGSNDGLLRGLYEMSDAGTCANEAALDCPNGSEAWGFVPTEAIERLETVRTGGARPIMDGTTAVADVCWNGSENAATCAPEDFRTLAIATMRHGGQSIIALDMTDGGVPTPLWQFNDHGDVAGDDLGLTYSVPSIGRVTVGSKKMWVAMMGGGLSTNHADGNAFYMLDVRTGRAVLDGNRTKWDNVSAASSSLAGRIALFRPVFPSPSADVDSAYFGDNVGQLWVTRTRETTNVNRDWQPEPFFTANVNTNSDRARGDGRMVSNPTEFAPLWRMNKASATRCTESDPCYTSCRLPLGSGGGACNRFDKRPKFYMRPKLDLKWDATQVKPDLFIGTGDTQNITATDSVTDQDFLFALHDSDYATSRVDRSGNARADDAHSAETLWVYALDQGERVVGEPAFIGGSVIFATYQPVGNGCRTFGDSYLYAFEPRTGTPKAALLDPITGTFKAVVKLQGVGPLSDLVSLNGNIYYSTARSPGRPEVMRTRQTGLGGRVHGWKRLR